MHIPVEQIKYSEYLAQLTELLGKPSTHIYIDTSFLMWLTNVGENARAEFREWLSSLTSARVHIPTWASHEFYRHFVDNKTANVAAKNAGELQKVLRRTYPSLVPAFCEPVGAHDPETDRMLARGVFSKLFELSANAEKWGTENAKKSSPEVIGLINEYGLRHKSLFGYFNDIGALTENRFSGRMPPGFKDEGKSDVERADAGSIGGNRAGDLVFWKEILDHVGRRRSFKWGRSSISAIVILTNDGKNDWIRGGGKSIHPDDPEISPLRTSWDPVPMIHPMLAHEAASLVGLESVMLANSQYLGTYFYKSNKSSTFASVATHTAFTSAQRVTPLNATKNATPLATSPDRSTTVTGSTSFEKKPPSAQASHLSNALFTRTASPDANEAASFAATISPMETINTGLSELLSPLRAEERSLDFFAWFGRHLANVAIRDRYTAADRMTDLVGLLGTFSAEHSAAIYCGLLVGNYIDESGKVRMPPPFDHLDALFRVSHMPFVSPGKMVLRQALADNGVRLLYGPDVFGSTLELKVLTKLIGTAHVLNGLFFGDSRDLMEPACTEPSLLFSTLFPGRPQLRTNDLASAACRIYGVPQSAITLGKDRNVTLPIDAGFSSPVSVFEVNE